MAQDLYYVDSGYLTPDSGYYVYIADAESAVSSAATISCDATKIAAGVVEEGSGNLTLVATMAVVISHIHGADLVAFSNAAIATQINVIRTTNVALTSVFSAAIDGSRGIYVSAQADAVASISIANRRVRFSEAAHSAAFSLACDATKILGGTVEEADSVLFNVVALSAVITKLAGANSSLTSAASVSIDAVRNRSASSSLSAVSLVSADAVRTLAGTASLTSAASQTTSISIIKQASVSISSAFTPTLSATVLKNSFAVLDCVSSLTASIQVIKSANIIAVSQSTVSVSATRLTSTSAALVSFAAVIAVGSKTINASISLSSQFTQTTESSRTRSFATLVTSAFTPTLTVNVFKNSFAVLDSVATVVINATATKPATVTLTSIISVNALVSKLVESSSTITASVSVSCFSAVWKNKIKKFTPVNAGITGVEKKFGNGSFVFSGTNSYASTPDTTDWDIGSIADASPWTFEFWIYPTANPSSPVYFLGQKTTTTTNGWGFIHNANGSISFQYRGNVGTSPSVPTTQNTTFTVGDVTLNQWNHVKLERDDTTYASGQRVEMFGYINGTRTLNTNDYIYRNTGGSYSIPFNATTPLYIGNTSVSVSAPTTYIDSVHLKFGVTDDNTGPATITVPTSETTQPTAYSKLLINLNDVAYDLSAITTQVGAALLTATTSMSVSISGLQKTSAVIISQSTLTAQARKTSEITLLAFSNANLSTVAQRVRGVSSTQASIFSQISLINKTVNPPITTNAIFSELVAVAITSVGVVQIENVSTMSVSVFKTARTTTNFVSQFAQTTETNNSKLVGLTSVMTAQSTVSVSPGTTKTSPITTNAIFAELVAVAKTGQGFITLDVVATQITVPVKTATAQANITASASLSSTANVIRGVAAGFNNVSSITISVAKTAGVLVPIVGVNTLTAVNTRFRNHIAVLTSVSQIQFPPNLTTGVSGITVVKDYSAALVSNFSTVIIPTKIKRGVAVVNVAAELGVKNPIRIRDFVCGTQFFVGLPVPIWFVTAELTASITRLRSAVIATDAVASQLTAIAKTGQGFITLDVVATQTTQAIKRVSVSSQITSSSSLVCQTTTSVSGISLQASAGTLTASARAVKKAIAQLSSVSTLSVQSSGQTVSFQAALQVNAFNLAVVDIIHIDAKLTWQIFAEDRLYSIQSENRVYSIPTEDREYTLQGV